MRLMRPSFFLLEGLQCDEYEHGSFLFKERKTVLKKIKNRITTL